MEGGRLRRIFATALGAEPPSGFDAATAVARGRRAARRRRRLAVAGAVAAVAAITVGVTGWPAAGGRVDPTMSAGRTAPTSSAAPSSAVSPSATPALRTPGCGTATVPPSLPPGYHDDQQDRLAERLDRGAKRDFRDVYAGVRLSYTEVRVELFRKPSAAFDRWLLEDFANDCVAVFDARYSKAELFAWTNQIAADVESGYWTRRGVRIQSIGPETFAGVVEVGVVEGYETARVELPKRYGPGVPLEIIQARCCITWAN